MEVHGYARKFSVDKILKGKMSVDEEWSLFHVMPPAPVLPWPPPPVDHVALSVDGSFSIEDGSAATGMILCRRDGSVIFAAYRFIFHCNDALEAEIHALMQGMALAIQHTVLPVIVQSDSSEALIRSLMSSREFIRIVQSDCSAYG